jgi:ribA/ribD-fused uncharacterized protein
MINKFSGEHAFLSNSHPFPVEFEGAVYPTVEHAFQAAKTFDTEERERVRMAKSPAAAKTIGKKLDLRDGWDYHRVDVMKLLVKQKFQDPELRDKLLATGDEPLVEGNLWHDRYWGQCQCPNHKGDGLNWLGRILTSIRKDLPSEAQKNGHSE